jgi:membrane protein
MINRIEKIRRIWLDPMKGALLHFNKSDGWAMASHVALSGMIAIFPFLIFTTSLAGFFSNKIEGKGIIGLAFDYWPKEIAEPIISEMGAVLNNGRPGLLTLGIVLAVFFATNGVEAIRSALNRAYRHNDRRPFWKQRAQSLLFVLVGAVLVIALSVVLIFTPLYYFLVEVVPTSFFIRFFQNGSNRLVVAFGLLTSVVFACHYWLPVLRRPLSAIWPGIALTLVSWLVAGKLFALYLKTFATYNATYAGLAGIMTALIFLYLMAVILIFGAEYNSEREKLQSHQTLSISDST